MQLLSGKVWPPQSAPAHQKGFDKHQQGMPTEGTDDESVPRLLGLAYPGANDPKIMFCVSNFLNVPTNTNRIVRGGHIIFFYHIIGSNMDHRRLRNKNVKTQKASLEGEKYFGRQTDLIMKTCI